jgi:hypothetical protein
MQKKLASMAVVIRDGKTGQKLSINPGEPQIGKPQ